MRQVLESQLLGWSWQSLGPETSVALAERMKEDDAVALRNAIAEVLLAEDATRVERSSAEVPGGTPFHSILYRDAGADGTRRMVLFGFRDAAVEAMVPLFGLAITVFTGHWGWGAASTVAGIGKTLWSKLTVLKRPGDADAIDVLEAIARVRAQHVATGEDVYPSGTEIAATLPLDDAARQRALEGLKTKAIIDAVSWGGQSGDVAHPDNRWRVKP